MYRKILFISINVIKDFPLNTKAILLLFLCLISMLITLTAKPFLTKDLNNLEIFSNLSSLLILYSGCLYLIGNIDFLKLLSYLTIFFVNIAFTLKWGLSILKLLRDSYENNFTKRFPRLFSFSRQLVLLFKKKITTQFLNNKEIGNELDHRKINPKKINLR